MQLCQFLHAAIVVSDLGRAEHFYGTVLGLQKVDRSLSFPGAWYQLGDVQIHLIQGAVPEYGESLPEKWGRSRHLAFTVTDLESSKAELLSHSVPVQMSSSGRSALFTQDPDGNVIELS